MDKFGRIIESFAKEENLPFESVDDQKSWSIVSQIEKLPAKIFFNSINDNMIIRSAFTFEAWRVDSDIIFKYANYLNEVASMGKFLIKIGDEEIENRRTIFVFSIRLENISEEVLKEHLPLIYSHFRKYYYFAIAYLMELMAQRLTLEEALTGFQKKINDQ